MKRKQFTFYGSFYEAMRKLPEDMWLGFLVNVVSYGLDEELLMEMNYVQAGMFELVKPNLDAARKKAEAGAKGGRKASKQVSKKENENEMEIEVKKENELEIELETETETNCGKGEDTPCQESVWMGFERFWNLYPVKIGQDEAWEQWQRLCPDAETACENLKLWMRTGRWIKENGRYIPRAAKFLEQEYYLQKPEVKVPMGATGHLGKAELEALEMLMREE